MYIYIHVLFYHVRYRYMHYPLVNVYITMENHICFMGKSTISMVMFNSYFDITKGYNVISVISYVIFFNT